MPVLQLIIILAAIGVLLWAVNTYIPMEARIKNIMNIVVAIAVVLWLLFDVFNIEKYFGDVRVGDSGTLQFAQTEALTCTKMTHTV
jgi:hypothetical protein